MSVGVPELLTVRDLPWETEALSIPYPDDKVFVDYIVQNNTRLDIQMKTRILNFEPKAVEGTEHPASLPCRATISETYFTRRFADGPMDVHF